jgi:hypothetical protein
MAQDRYQYQVSINIVNKPLSSVKDWKFLGLSHYQLMRDDSSPWDRSENCLRH